ncbi:MAG TPA: ABC transporter permease [Ardenticatenaceae bacterium]|nr:ABC transporter permease [Ardenticatenaceae bacterium]
MDEAIQPAVASSPRVAVVHPVLPPRRTAIGTLLTFLRRNHLALAGVLIVLAWVFITIAAPVLAPYGPYQQNISDRLDPPTAEHRFGTDQLGRDVLSRVMYGGRISLPAALAVILLAGIVGTIVGALAGFRGGALEEAAMRVTDVFMAFPTIILAMAVAAALGPSIGNAVVALVIVWWPNYARIVRGLVLTVKENDYVEAARAVGAPGRYVLWRTILPNCVGPLLVMATLDLGNAILVFAGLSFLGLGAEPSRPEWGRMVSDGISFFDQWWMAAFPGLAILTLVMGFNFVGDGLRDALDPRLRSQL